jgi:ABC-type polysaccharide/polyol phosphate transport system ATPase subunit
MGLSQRDIKKIFNEIVNFSELKEFINMPIYKFSSGMKARLNFSISIYCLDYHKPDILLLDEVFGSGGDISFQLKAEKKMSEFIKEGVTVLLVSHDLEIVKNYCNRVIILNKGEIVKIGEPKEIINEYKKSKTRNN